MIYFIRSEGFVKIGLTSSRDSLTGRFDSLQCGNPYHITLLGVMPGLAEAEAELHAKFAVDHYRGEWFRLSPALASFIEANCRPLIMDISAEELGVMATAVAIAAATEPISEFLNNHVRPEGRISSSALYAAFAEYWSAAHPDMDTPTHNVFGRLVAESGFVRLKTGGGRSWYRASLVDSNFPEKYQDTQAHINQVS